MDYGVLLYSIQTQQEFHDTLYEVISTMSKTIKDALQCKKKEFNVAFVFEENTLHTLKKSFLQNKQTNNKNMFLL